MKSFIFATVASLGLAISPGSANAATADPTGRTELGVDIGQAGASASDHQKFLQTLSASQQANVRKQCLVIVAQPGTYAPGVVAFCKDVNAAPAETAAASSPVDTFSVTIPQDAVLSYNLVGREVYNGAKEDVGEIKDLVLEGDKLIGYVVSVGGFLGMGKRYVVVSPAAIAISYDQANSKWLAKMDVSKDQLKNAPEFKYEGKFKQ